MSRCISSSAVSRSKARPMASMRPASSVLSGVLFMVLSWLKVAMAQLCPTQTLFTTCKTGFCLDGLSAAKKVELQK